VISHLEALFHTVTKGPNAIQ